MRRRLSKTVLCLLLTGLLTGCFQIQISGTVVGSTITITRVDGVGGSLVVGQSEGEAPWIGALGLAFWQELPPLWKIWLSGIVHIPGDLVIDPEAYYLTTASGGVDNDPFRTRDLSSPPTAVSGDLHAIVKGSRLLEGNVQISVITEAYYQELKAELPGLTNAQITQRLDQLAASTLTNVDDVAAVNYNDAMRWSYLLDEAKYKGKSSRLGEMADLYAPDKYSETEAQLLAKALVDDVDAPGTVVAVCASVVHQSPTGMPQFLSRIEIDTDLGPNPPGLFSMTIPGANDGKAITIDVAKETGFFGIYSYGNYKIGKVVIGSVNITSSFAALPTINVTEKAGTLWCQNVRVPL